MNKKKVGRPKKPVITTISQTGKKPIPTCKQCNKKHWPFPKCEGWKQHGKAMLDKPKRMAKKTLPFDKETKEMAAKYVEKYNLKPTAKEIKTAIRVDHATEKEPSRTVLMGFAKARGVKNYRVLNKAELAEVISPDVTQETIDKVVKGAVDRWQSGWGENGGRTHKTKETKALEDTFFNKGEQTHE